MEAMKADREQWKETSCRGFGRSKFAVQPSEKEEPFVNLDYKLGVTPGKGHLLPIFAHSKKESLLKDRNDRSRGIRGPIPPQGGPLRGSE